MVKRDTRWPMHDNTVMLRVSVLDEAIGLEEVEAVDAHDRGDVPGFHLDWCFGDLLHGEDEMQIRKMNSPALPLR